MQPNYVFALASASMLFAAGIFLPFSFILIITGYMLVFYEVMRTTHVSYGYWCVWISVFWLLHGSWYCYDAYHFSKSIVCTIFWCLMMIAYPVSAFMVIVFCVKQIVPQKWYVSLRCIIWIGVLFVYDIWLAHGILLIFGYQLGYYLARFVLPLGYYSWWLKIGSVIGLSGINMLLLLMSAGIAWMVYRVHNRLWHFLNAALVLFLWACSYWYQSMPEQEGWFWHRTCLALRACKQQHWLEDAQEIAYTIISVACSQKTVRLILAPESYYPHVYNNTVDMIVCQSLIGNVTSFIFGTSEWADQYLQAGACCIDRQYDQRYSQGKYACIPWAEYIPGSNQWIAPYLFCPGRRPIVPALHTDSKLVLSFDGVHNEIKILLCSELFFGLGFQQQVSPDIYLALVSDAWCSACYQRTLCLLCARWQAAIKKRWVWYISSSLAYMIDRNGHYWPLRRM